jgi:hypothetical protein
MRGHPPCPGITMRRDAKSECVRAVAMRPSPVWVSFSQESGAMEGRAVQLTKITMQVFSQQRSRESRGEQQENGKQRRRYAAHAGGEASFPPAGI